MIVQVCNEQINMSDVYSMNKTAANIWERIDKGGCTFDELLEFICDTYDVLRSGSLMVLFTEKFPICINDGYIKNT